MLVRIGEPEKEPSFINVRLIIVVIIRSITFHIHQNKFCTCVLNLLLEYHWAGRPTTGTQCYGLMKKDPKTKEEKPDAVKSGKRVKSLQPRAVPSKSYILPIL